MYNLRILGASQGGNLRLYHLATPLRRKNLPLADFFLTFLDVANYTCLNLSGGANYAIRDKNGIILA